MYAQLTYFGPTRDAAVPGARDRASRERIRPAIENDPQIQDELAAARGGPRAAARPRSHRRLPGQRAQRRDGDGMTGTPTGWRVDVYRSSACFVARNLAVHTVCGRIPIREAVVDVSSDGSPAAVRAVLGLTGIDTGNRRRDRDLAAPRLLDTARWPMLGLPGLVEATGPGRWRVLGTLTAHGTATYVVLDVETTHDGDEVRAHASTTFDRRALGIRAPRLLIGREISISLHAVLRLWPLPTSLTHTSVDDAAGTARGQRPATRSARS